MRIFGGVRPAAAGALLLVLVAGCGSTVTDQRAGTRTGGADRSAIPSPRATGGGAPVAFCPAPEAGPAPSPCISYSEEQRYADNHAYKQEMPLSESARADNQPRVQALQAALTKLAGGPLDEDGLRRATAEATGTEPATVHVELWRDRSYAQVVVEAGSGCLKGTINEGRVTAETTGFIADGGCVPAVGH
ncbi:precorrin-3B C(17)-methyltransferase [Kitasatospora sp. NPDC048540]|uniref:precorrin-3B C(17)-methyltransferase n=1 Tax=Kitasatospora sp. NPDC048540 TaxID=3155634 RepID=UPI0033F94E72